MILVKLEHYTYMVDLLDHVGYLQEVKIIIMKFTINHMWAHGGLCLVLAKFMVMWRWGNTLLNESLN
jgi:hypothetical protein